MNDFLSPRRAAPALSKKKLLLTLVAALAAGLAALLVTFTLINLHPSGTSPVRRGLLFQTSTLNALAAGVYDGPVTFGTLKKHGDFGLGTFNALDGEMIGLDGRFYQIKADGQVSLVADNQQTPFAMVTFFSPDKSVNLDAPLDFRQLQNFVDKQLPSPNLLYAVKLTGQFLFVKTRSVPRQAKPYPPLVDVAQRQSVFELRQVQGTVVGFRLPDYLQGLNLPGYHCHFLTSDLQAGGHLLDCRMTQGQVEIAVIDQFSLSLPEGDFGLQDLSRIRHGDLERIEK